MATKKKAVKITPATPKGKFTDVVLYEELDGGECFLRLDGVGGLWIKAYNEYIDCCVNIEDGVYEEDMYGTPVEPVDVEIKWTKRK